MKQNIFTAAFAGAVFALSLPVAAQGLDTSDYECLIQPRAIVNVASPVAGIVEDVLVEEGQIVEEGDVIARLKSDVEAANLELARARAAYDGAILLRIERAALAQKKFERAQELKAQQVIADSAYDEVESEARIAELSIEEARHEKRLAELELARFEALMEQKIIRSPVNGVVVQQLLWPGENANEQAQVVTVARLDPLEIRVFAPTEIYGQVGIGTLATIRPVPPLSGEFEASVSMIEPVFDAASDTIRMRLLLPNPDYALPAGIPCRIEFHPDLASQ